MKRWLPIVAAAFLIAGCDSGNEEPPATPPVGVDTTGSSAPSSDSPASGASSGEAAGTTAGATAEAEAGGAEAGGAAQAVSTEEVHALLKKHNCTSCHAIDKKLVGPAYREVAQKYQGDSSARRHLIDKVVKGGSGVWGPVPMPPHPNVPEADIEAIVDWTLAGAN